MGKLHFSQSKLSKFLNGKGFYVALAVCLVGAGAASWVAVNKTMKGLDSVTSDDFGLSFTASEEAGLTGTAEESTPSATIVGRNESEIPIESSASSASRPSSSQESTNSEGTESSQKASTKPEQSQTLLYILPVSGNFLNDYSHGELVKSQTLNDWRTHDGIDIAAEEGTIVGAAADGTVVSAYQDALWGSIVIIAHADGCQSVYAALASELLVSKGDTVRVDQPIGSVGIADAESDLPPHVHFGIRRAGIYTDPMDFITNAERPE
jgi:murein DD-endopeptidase MepM/ murein hydrolase activator NlpD